MTHNQVLISLVRNAMPSLMAHQLIGVQPMTGPVGEIFSSRANWPGGRVKMEKIHYQHFLRVYNRRSSHHPEYLTSLGYQTARLPIANVIEAIRWCRNTLKPGSYIRSSKDFWFANDRDYTLFVLKWS